MSSAVRTIDDGVRRDDPTPLRERFCELTPAEVDDLVEYAASSGAVACIAALLDLGVSPDHEGDLQASSFLEYACYSDKPEAVELLLRGGASPTLGVPLVAAAQSGKVEMVRLLLDAGAPPDQGHAGFPTALGVAVMNRNQAMADLLVARGAKRIKGGAPAPRPSACARCPGNHRHQVATEVRSWVRMEGDLGSKLGNRERGPSSSILPEQAPERPPLSIAQAALGRSRDDRGPYSPDTPPHSPLNKRPRPPRSALGAGMRS